MDFLYLSQFAFFVPQMRALVLLKFDWQMILSFCIRVINKLNFEFVYCSFLPLRHHHGERTYCRPTLILPCSYHVDDYRRPHLLHSWSTSRYHVCWHNNVPVADDVVRVYSQIRLFWRDEYSIRLTNEDRGHIITANRCNSIGCSACSCTISHQDNITRCDIIIYVTLLEFCVKSSSSCIAYSTD